MSTLDMEGCSEHALVTTDRQIDRLVRTIHGLLTTADGKRAFVRSEASWLAYRRASCEAEASKFAGGTLAPLQDVDCQVERNTTHLRELTAMKRLLARR